MQNIINIFTAPTKAFEDLNEKPTWVIPFIITVLVALVTQYLTLDLNLDYRIEMMEARGMSDQQIEQSQQQMQGPLKYIGLILAPIFIPIFWAIIALILLGFSKITIPEGLNFKKSFSIIAWTSLIGSLLAILLTAIIMAKGSVHGVALDFSVLMDTPAVGESKSIMYRIMSKLDPFTLWTMFLWALGLKVMGKVEMSKAITPVAIIWVLWVAVSVGLGGVFESLGF